MPSAADIAKRLLETGEDIDWSPRPGDPDAATPEAVDKFTGTQAFDEGSADVLRDARALYRKCQRTGLLAVVEKSGVDQDSIAQALIQIALEQRGSLGGKKAYRLFKRHGRFEL